MASTSHLGITLLEQSQAQKEITINEALARIDAVLNAGVVDRDLATPPGSPADGAVYIIAASPTGAWAGKAGQITYFDQIWRFIEPKEGITLWVNDEDVQVVYNGSGWQVLVSGGGGGGGSGSDVANVAGGRLSLTSGTPVTVSDVTSAGTIYFTPYKGNRLALYNGTAWEVLGFNELSISLASGFTSGRVYDVFAYNNAGNVALETLIWTNGTTRATALALQDGVYVKSGATTRRYLGSFYTVSATTTEDSKARRCLWNYQHRVCRPLASALESASSWNYTSTTWRQANANSANKLNFLIGVTEDLVNAQVPAITTYSSTLTYRSVAVGIGLDSTTVNSASCAVEGRCNSAVQGLIQASYDDMVAVGYHALNWIERSDTTDIQSFYPTMMAGYSVPRMTGRVFA